MKIAKKESANNDRQLTFLRELWLLTMIYLEQDTLSGCAYQHTGNDIEGIGSSNFVGLISKGWEF